MKKIVIPKDFFKDLDFKIEVSPFGDKVCCCGYVNCVDLDCLKFSLLTKPYENNDGKSN